MRRIVVAVVAALLLGACSGSGNIKIKDPGPVPVTTTTTAVDYSAVGLKGVSSRSATTLALGPGGATLQGTVLGPDGPVDQAKVHVERLAGNGSAVTDVATLADGTWSVPKILGGRYRVRAWKTPELALTKPQIFFLQASETKKVELRVDRYAGASVAASIAPNPPVIDEPANLFVLIAARQVDDTGVVRATAITGAAVELSGSGYQLETSNPTVTDGNGVAEWRVRCTNSSAALSITIGNGGSYPVELPPCAASGQPTETSEATTTTTRRGSATTRR